MTAIVLRGDARALPLPDGCVDLIVTSPPYFGLRSYTDGCPTCAERARAGNRGYMERYCPGCRRVFTSGRNKCHVCDLTTLRTEATKAAPKTDCPDCGGTGQRHYDGQIGSEATPAEWVAALVECTREWMRVLKPSGSMFVNLGDKYSGAQQQTHGHQSTTTSSAYWQRTNPKVTGVPAKSLYGLPWRYALACTDQLGLILRRDIIWAKPNGLPESVTDRCRSSHEYLFHLVRQPRYYAAVDEIREAHAPPAGGRGAVLNGMRAQLPSGDRNAGISGIRPEPNPLGKLPGSVWDIPSQPLTVPAHLGVDHFAAFPMELPRRCVLGWSPPGVCVACGEGRRPVSVGTKVPHYAGGSKGARNGMRRSGTPHDDDALPRTNTLVTITGYACSCKVWCDSCGWSHEPGPSCLDSTPWHLPPTRPAIVLDPFSGTGTTALVASMLGRVGIGIDRSADYTRLARWRTTDPGERAKAMQVPKPPPVPDGMEALF